MQQQVLALPPTMLSDGGVELARYRPIHAIHLGCRWGRQALLLRSVASAGKLLLSYIMQVYVVEQEPPQYHAVSTPPTSTMR